MEARSGVRHSGVRQPADVTRRHQRRLSDRMEDLTVSENDGKKAIVTILNEQAPSKRVYLTKLVRPDASGIWTVIGYDPR
jgi:hypothetical protein